MIKKSLATALLVCSVPALASASWFLSTQAKSAGGTIRITADGNTASQTVVDGPVFKPYTTSGDIPVTVTPEPGYSIASYVLDGTQHGSSLNPLKLASLATVLPGSTSDKSFAVTFVGDGVSVTASNPGGTVTPSSVGNLTYGYTLQNKLTFVFAPRSGYTITKISGVPAGASVVVPNTVNGRATVTFPAGYQFTQSLSMVAESVNSTPSINQILPQTVVQGASVTLNASVNAVDNPVYTWTYVSGPANTSKVVKDANGKVMTFVVPGPAIAAFPAVTNADGSVTCAAASKVESVSMTLPTVTSDVPLVNGQYKFLVSVPNPVAGGKPLTKLATVNVFANTAATATQCQFCHTANGIGGADLSSKWAASAHSQNSCSSCHVGADTGGHPSSVTKANVDPTTFMITAGPGAGTSFCSSCHSYSAGRPIPTWHTTQTNCASCHGGDVHDIKTVPKVNIATLESSATACSNCHNPESGKFSASKHWNNSYEYSTYDSASSYDIFYNGAPAMGSASLTDPNEIPSINPNQSWNVFEWENGKTKPTAPVTCSTKCHFQAQKSASVVGSSTLYPVSNVQGCLACHSGGLMTGGTFQNGTSAHLAHPGDALSSNTCEMCHYSATGTGHGQTTVEFHASKHWNNDFEYGPEFTEGQVAGQINPNEAWYTKENGALTTCAYNCHFKPNLGPLGELKADGTVAKDGYAKNRPGLDGCVSCHDPHKPTTDAVSTCFECHTGSHHGGTTNGYKASVHYQSEAFHPSEETLYNTSTFKIVKADCLACHNPHLPEQTTYTAGSQNKNINVCANCHNGIDAQVKLIGKVVHFASASTAATVAPSGLSYVGSAGRPVNSCTECHFNYNPHALTGFTNNSAAAVLPSWAESGHGSLNAETWKADDHRYKANNDRPGTTAGVTPANSKDNFCVHCHTAKGLVQFVNTADPKHPVFTNISSVGDRSNWDASPLVCSGCHAPDASGATTSQVRVVPAAVGFYNVSSSSTNFLSAKISVQHQFPNYGMSNLCMTCHVGAAGSGEVIKLAYAQNPNFGGSYVNPHHGYAGATLGQYGMYEYGDYSYLRNSHAAIGGTANGPCVSCHYNGLDHSLKAVNDNGTAANPVCAGCHGASFSVSQAKANYQASLTVLKNLLVANNLPIARASADWGSGLTGANNMGAAMNYFNLSTDATDAAAYVHNPNYAKRVLFDTIDWLAHHAQTGSISDVMANPTYTAGLTDDQIAGAKGELGSVSGTSAAINNSGVCADCHAGATVPGTNVNIVSEYQASGHAASSHGPSCTSCHSSAAGDQNHPVNGPMSKNYLKVEANCLGCHNGNYSRNIDGFNHYANTPDAAFSNISAAAFVGYAGKGINACSNCHFGFDGHGIGAATTQTFATNSNILAAWSESEHGNRTGLAWTPGTGATGHDWRNSGSAANFQQSIPANDCVRCHTSDGFNQFVTSNFNNVNNVGAADGNRYNAPLSCSACHAADANGSATAARLTAVKTAGSVGVASFYNISTADKTSKATLKSRIAANFPDVGESNLCISCHSGRVAGPNLADLAATGKWDLSNSSFQNSHYMAAAGTMYMKGGFKNFTTLTAPAPSNNEGTPFASTKTYNQTLSADSGSTPDGDAKGQTSAHRRLGTPAIVGTETYLPAGTSAIDSNGPCVTCHMKAYNPIAGNGFTPPSAGRPAAGHSLKIDEATAEELCLQCHGDAPHLDGGDGRGNAKYTTLTNLADMQKAMMEPQSECLQNGLTLIKQILLKKYLIKYDQANYPYFFDLQKDATGKTAVTDWTRKSVAGLSDVAGLGSTVTAIPAGGLNQVQAYRLMGACFNLNLLSRDPGAYLHARTYSQRLVYDTVDFLDNNRIDFTSLTTARALTAAGVDGLVGVYVGTNINVFASDGTLATESMAWLSGTHYTDTSSGNTLKPMKLRP